MVSVKTIMIGRKTDSVGKCFGQSTAYFGNLEKNWQIKIEWSSRRPPAIFLVIIRKSAVFHLAHAFFSYVRHLFQIFNKT